MWIIAMLGPASLLRTLSKVTTSLCLLSSCSHVTGGGGQADVLGAGLQPLDGWIVIVKPMCFCVFCISLFVFASLYFSFTFVVSQLIWWSGCVRCSLYAAYAVHPAQPLKSPKTANRHSFSVFQHFPDYSFIQSQNLKDGNIFKKKFHWHTLYNR